jgi:hypothetical protein
MPPIQIVVGSVLVCPVLIWHDIIYLPNEYYCFVSFTRIRSFLWLVFICYGLPLCYLLLIYIRITLFIRQQPNNLALAIKRRQQRDLHAMQRIFINVGLLMILGLPCIVVLIMSFINGVEHPLAYGIMWIGAEVSIAALCIEMIFMTPQLKNIVMRRRQQSRVTNIEGSMQMRPVATVH